jgi:hypothetical protein
MPTNFIVQRISVGFGLLSAILIVAWLIKFLLFPVVVIALIAFLSFMVGDWAIYFWENEKELIAKFKASFKP